MQYIQHGGAPHARGRGENLGSTTAEAPKPFVKEVRHVNAIGSIILQIALNQWWGLTRQHNIPLLFSLQARKDCIAQ